MRALALGLLLLACAPDVPCEYGGNDCPGGAACIRWGNTDRRCEAPCDETCGTCCSYAEQEREAYCVPEEWRETWCHAER